MRARSVSILVLSALLCSFAWAEGARSSFTVRGFGTLRLEIPAAWIEAGPSVSDPALVNVSYMLANNPKFQMIITAQDGKSYAGIKDPLAEIERRVKQSGQGWLTGSVETEVAVKHLDGASFHGRYYKLTDKSDPLPAGEFRYITQGIGLIGNLVIAFTVFSNESPAPFIDQGLRALQNARLERVK